MRRYGGWGGGWGMRRGWGGWGRMGGWGWRRRGMGCFPCCSLILVLPLIAFVGLAVSLAVHFL